MILGFRGFRVWGFRGSVCFRATQKEAPLLRVPTLHGLLCLSRIAIAPLALLALPALLDPHFIWGPGPVH